MVAVGSRHQGSADRFADEFGIPNRHASYEALVADPEVDVVYVATPHPWHHANTLLALEAGQPVLVEKAFTMSAAEAENLVDTARSRGLFLMEAMWTRFLPHMAEIRRLVANGSLGDIVTVMADHGQWFPKDRDSRLLPRARWRRPPRPRRLPGVIRGGPSPTLSNHGAAVASGTKETRSPVACGKAS